MGELKADWHINEDIGDFHTTEEPLEIKIKDNSLQFALIYEVTEDSTHSFSIIPIEPEFSFKGQLTVILHNQKTTEKDIIKTMSIQFTPEDFDLQPISFDLSQGEISDQENGWIIYDNETKEIKSGLYFTIIIDPPEKLINRFSQFKIETEKKLLDSFPSPLYKNNYGVYDMNLVFNKTSYNMYIPFTTSLCQAGCLIINCTTDFPNRKFTFRIIDSLYEEGSIIAFLFFFKYENDLVKIKKKFQFDKTNRTFEIELPFSISEILDYSKGFLSINSVNSIFGIKYKTLDVICTYPIRLKNSLKDGFYGIKYFIPLSLLSKLMQLNLSFNNQIIINPIFTNSLSISPSILINAEEYTLIDWDEFLLHAITTLQINYYKENVVFDILVTIVNKDESKNFSSFLASVSQKSINLPDFNLDKPIRETGFVHIYDNLSEVIEMDIKIRIYNDNYNELSKTEEDEIAYSLCKDNDDITSCNGFMVFATNESDLFNLNEEPHDDEIDESFNANNTYKNDTGYVGLNNQGATCYLNSFIQTLFHLPEFRRLIYDMPTTGNEDLKTSIPLNIQRLFYQLQFGNKSCSTVNLTKSFGWDSNEAFQQNDIEEFSRALIDNLEKKMKGTNLQDSIPHLFRGRFRSYIKCKNVDYKTLKEETFYDLSLDVKGIPNLSESFKSYLKQDELTGNNQYNTDEFGKQDAIMGTEFLEFPPVLHIHLRRFKFDIDSITGMIKIDDHFEFQETIDLTEYLADDSPQKNSSNIYDLYGVLVHSGNYNSGHYYAFLRTSTDPQWYKFNDSFVSKETVENAVYGNFGETDRHYSAYMLIYVRREDAKSLFEPVKDETVPKHLKTFYEDKNATKTRNIKVYFIHENYLKINVAEKVLRFFNKNEVENKESLSDYEMHIEEYDRSTTTSELYILLSSLYLVEESQLRLWICYYQKVPRKVILSSDDTTLDELTKGRNKLYVLVQPIKEDDHFNFKQEIMIYINFFFTENLLKRQSNEDVELLNKQLSAPLQYLLSMPISQNGKVSSIIPVINKKLGFPSSIELDCYHVPLNNQLQKLSYDSNLIDYGIGNGSILIFQMKQESIEKIPKGSLKLNFDFQLPTKKQNENNLDSSLKLYTEYEFIHDKNPLNSVENFLAKYFIAEVYNYNNLTKPLFNIKLNSKIKSNKAKDCVVQAAIENKNINGNEKVTLLQLSQYGIYKISDFEISNSVIHKFYLAVQSYNLNQTEITVQFSPDSKTVTIEKTIQLRDCKTFDDIFNAFKSSLSKEETTKEFSTNDNKFRYLLIQNGRIEKVVTQYNYLCDLNNDEIMRIEIIPKCQEYLLDSFTLKSFYSNVDFTKTLSFGQPFVIDIIDNEKFSETKKRLANYMNLPDGESVCNFIFYLNVVKKSILDLAILKETLLYGNDSSKKTIKNEYAVLEKNGIQIIRLDDSSDISDFTFYSSFMLQLEIISDKLDELKNEFKDDFKITKISVEKSVEKTVSTNHHDLKIYN